MSQSQFDSYIRAHLPKLGDRPFCLYKLSKSKIAEQIHASTPRELKDLSYNGVILVSTVTHLHEAAPAVPRPQRPSRTITSTPQVVPVLVPPPQNQDPLEEAEQISVSNSVDIELGGVGATFEERVQMTRERRSGVQQIQVIRDEIVTVAESMYSDSTILQCSGLYVQFEGEMGVDLNGVTQDFFPLTGEKHLVPVVREKDTCISSFRREKS